MSIEETNGSAAAGNPAGTAPAGGDGSTAGAGEWWRGLQDEGNRTLAQAKGWKAPDDAIRSYAELERVHGKLSGEALKVPGADASPEQWAAFYKAVGRPDAPEGYRFTMPDGAPENLPYNQANAERLKAWCHEAGLTPAQAQVIHDGAMSLFADDFRAYSEREAKAEADATVALVKEWGEPDSVGFRRNVEMADRAIRQLGGTALKKELTAAGILGPAGEVRSPALAIALAKVGSQLFAEDQLYGGPHSVVSPWSDKSLNLTEQGKIIRSDPHRAKALIEAAGKSPKDYGL